MGGRVAERLRELGLELPPQHPPAGNYVAYVVTGRQIWVSGVGPTWGRELRGAGKIGREVGFDDGLAAARLTALNLLAHANHALDGDLDRVRRCVKVFGLVNAIPGYADAHLVVDAASGLLADLLGDQGRHARSVTVAPSLPMNITVELDAVFEFA